MKLLSDFTDYYDAQFDNEGLEFKRYSNKGKHSPVSMWEILRLLEIHNNVPLFGYPYSLYHEMSPDEHVIVYTQPYYKQTKQMTLEEADKDFSSCLAVQVLKNTDPKVSFYKLLHIGKSILWLSYNTDGSCEVSSPIKKNYEKDTYSCFKLYSIDYIRDVKKNCIYAINLDTSPCLENTPVKNLLSPEKILEFLNETGNVLQTTASEV